MTDMHDDEMETADAAVAEARAERGREVLLAGLIGAAIGAGLGILAGRALADEGPRLAEATRRARLKARRAMAATPVRDVAPAVRNVVADVREAAERAIARELRDMRRAMRRRREELER